MKHLVTLQPPQVAGSTGYWHSTHLLLVIQSGVSVQRGCRPHLRGSSHLRSPSPKTPSGASRDLPAVVSTVRRVLFCRFLWVFELTPFIFGSCFNEFSLFYDSLLGSTTPRLGFLVSRFLVLCVPRSFHFIPWVLNCSCAISSHLYMVNMNSPGRLCQT